MGNAPRLLRGCGLWLAGREPISSPMSSIAKLGMSSVALALCMQSAAADEGSPVAQVASRACGALLSRVQAVPGTDPIFLRSYDPSSGGAPTIDGAYTYDNALAVIALVAC